MAPLPHFSKPDSRRIVLMQGIVTAVGKPEVWGLSCASPRSTCRRLFSEPWAGGPDSAFGWPWRVSVSFSVGPTC